MVKIGPTMIGNYLIGKLHTKSIDNLLGTKFNLFDRKFNFLLKN